MSITVDLGRDVAQAVADALNAQTFSIEFEAKRGWHPILNIEETEKPAVTVVPDTKRTTLLNRAGTRQNLVAIDVVIQRQHGDGNPGQVAPVERCDKLADLAQEVEDFLGLPANAVTVGSESIALKASPTEVDTEIDKDALLSNGIFKVLVKVVYSIVR